MWRLLVVLAACGSSHATIDAPPCAPATLFLDRQGGAFDHGAVDDATRNLSVLLDGPRTLPAWPYDDATWTETASCIRDALSPFAIAVTEVDPASAPHLEIVFTTSYWAGDAVANIIPSSCRPDHQIELVFGAAVVSATNACELAVGGFAEMTAQLSASENCLDFTSPAVDCGLRRFLTGPQICVDASDQAAPCRCGVATTQDTFAAMSARFPTCSGE